MRRDRRRRGERGFTLIELMITVAIVGILAALGIVGYLRYVYAAQSSEAKTVIGMIRGGEEAYKSEMLLYLGCSSSITDYYPNKTPNDSRWAWVQPGDSRFTSATTGWALLNVQPDAPVRFGYAVVAGVGGTLTSPSDFASPPTMPTVSAGVPWYVIQAKNDHNNNGKFAVFTSTSTNGEILSQNEDE